MRIFPSADNAHFPALFASGGRVSTWMKHTARLIPAILLNTTLILFSAGFLQGKGSFRPSFYQEHGRRGRRHLELGESPNHLDCVSSAFRRRLTASYMQGPFREGDTSPRNDTVAGNGEVIVSAQGRICQEPERFSYQVGRSLLLF